MSLISWEVQKEIMDRNEVLSEQAENAAATVQEVCNDLLDRADHLEGLIPYAPNDGARRDRFAEVDFLRSQVERLRGIEW